MSQSREFDVVVWGATGFTGRLVAEYLYRQYGVNKSVKWAMAGRNKSKLEAVRKEVANSKVPLIVADSHDAASLAALTKRTKVVCSTVGPYANYGKPLVAACVQNQTHYCDLAGESVFIRDMIDEHHETAQANGTKIVHSCGFDSIPSDLGVYFTQKAAVAESGTPATQIKMRVKDFVGEFSGGTYASISNMLEMAEKNPSLYKVLGNPYALNPKGEQQGPDTSGLKTVVYDKTAKSWIYPFVMEGINTKIVRRSNAIAGFPYGKDFRYEEAVMAGDGEKGKHIAIKTATQMAAMTAPSGSPEKAAMDKMMPKPGEGPSKESREAGYYDLRLFTTLANGKKLIGKVTGDMDPGYGSTSKMIAECSVCLAKDTLPNTAGILTASTAMGAAILERLEENAGLTFSYCEG